MQGGIIARASETPVILDYRSAGAGVAPHAPVGCSSWSNPWAEINCCPTQGRERQRTDDQRARLEVSPREQREPPTVADLTTNEEPGHEKTGVSPRHAGFGMMATDTRDRSRVIRYTAKQRLTCANWGAALGSRTPDLRITSDQHLESYSFYQRL